MAEAARPAPGSLVGQGRAADVYDVGGGRVLRRYRTARRPGAVEAEVAVMRHVAARGYPVPTVYDVDGDDLVMERLEGTTMLTALERRPWRARPLADQLAELHHRLAAIDVGDLAAVVPTRFGPPTAVLHLDFHPDNVMLTADGPVVFDWSNAALGPAPADVALTWLIGATSSIDATGPARFAIAAVRNRFLRRYVDRCGRDAAAGLLPVVAEARLLDPNVRPEEAARIRALVAAQR